MKSKNKKTITMLSLVAIAVLILIGGYLYWQYIYPTAPILSGATVNREVTVISDKDLDTAKKILDENNIKYIISSDKISLLVGEIYAERAYLCLKDASFDCELITYDPSIVQISDIKK